MFKNLFRKEKPRVFLGNLAVVPRTGIKKHFDQWGAFESTDLDSSLSMNLKSIFSLPLASEVDSPRKTDLVIDVVVTKFQAGEALGCTAGDFGFPVMWRPKVSVSSRLYYLVSGATKSTFSQTEKMSLTQYLNRIFSWRAFWRFRPIFDSKDLEYLLYQACNKLLLKIKQKYDL
ncbi:hypothetical protein [Gynuella sunshinyii]|uniref:Uncharacterized protein n=1 Tax=Gynuella sunshinyii YC6258 TaxID=1445510 RepID=A0A0C5VKP6_9GAMM|nr:hypothetical protein [Gynuella sunshinyii]AJQ94866.1 hypothetical Protein YC6258_02828 [Gynuella sunshinyii YC6258]